MTLAKEYSPTRVLRDRYAEKLEPCAALARSRRAERARRTGSGDQLLSGRDLLYTGLPVRSS